MGGTRGGCRVVATWGAMLAAPGCGDDDGGRAWEPPAATSEADSGSGGGLGTGGTEAEACEPGVVRPCLCADGLSLGEQTCDDAGAGFSACACDGETGEDAGSTGEPLPRLPAEVCYPGADGAGTTCLPLVAFYADLPAGYEYPTPMLGNGQDRPPLGMIDVQAASGSLSLAPNFVLDELAQPAVGRWAVIQPHAVVALQAMRDAAGPITVVTGYLSPAANAAQGGEPYARHQYGDGFDLDPVNATVPELADLCVAEGGAVVEFETHLHCELSATPLDEDFFGPPPGAAAPGGGALARRGGELMAWIEPEGHGYWAPADGFEEGEPRREWTARDAAGEVLVVEVGRRFEPPPGTAEIEVLVGGRVLQSLDVWPAR